MQVNSYPERVEAQHGAFESRHKNTCECGKHQGVGAWSPQKRAEVYAFQRDRLPTYYTFEMKRYLESYEKTHGFVHYEKR